MLVVVQSWGLHSLTLMWCVSHGTSEVSAGLGGCQLLYQHRGVFTSHFSILLDLLVLKWCYKHTCTEAHTQLKRSNITADEAALRT